MSTPVQAGDVLRQKYRVERVLGEGGMGLVVAAWHLRLEQRVAIKFLHEAMLEKPEIVERFLREARAASKIENDHVARVLDVDTLESGAPFMVMEYLEGQDLSFVRREGRVLSVVEAAGYLLQACEAVSDAHASGIVHRDLKPANLFLTRRRDGRPWVKVLDFGISKLTGPGGAEVSMTKTSSVMGSIEYMSPEQMMASKHVDARADIWALGVILYELTTARVPFPGETLTHVCALVMNSEPSPVGSLRGDVPPALDHVIARCLRKDREHRYGSVIELMQDLTALANGTTPQASLSTAASFVPAPSLTASGTALLAGHESFPRRSPSSGPAHANTAGALTSDRPTKTEKRSPAPVIAGIAVLVAAAVGFAVFFGRGSGATDTAGSPRAPATAPSAEKAPAPPAAATASAPEVTPSAEPTSAPSASATETPSQAPTAKAQAHAPSKPPQAAPKREPKKPGPGAVDPFGGQR